MSLVIPIAHDFTCGWCWVGLSQVKKLQQEFPVTFDWLAYELYPETEELPGPSAARPEEIPNKPKTPSRMALAYAAQDMDPPTNKHPLIRTHNAHEAVEFAKTEGVQDALVERLYKAFWEENTNINEVSVLLTLSDGIVGDLDGMQRAIEERRFKDKIVPFDDPAYASGVFNVPTYWIDGERYAEQPYRVVAHALRKFITANV